MHKRYDYCPNCMQAIDENEKFCSGCGFDIEGYEENEQALKPCTMLKDRYMVGKVIGVGGFGVTYLGWDAVLQTYVAVKEYFPQFFAYRTTEITQSQIIPTDAKKEPYEKGLKRYLEEAQNLSKFYQLPGIVSVKDFFYENGTGYIVMEYIDGINLKQYLNDNGGKIPESKVRTLIKPVLESLMEVHEAGLIHRDISPDNVMVDKKNRIKLIDFGSVRDQSTESEKTYTVTLKHGYAPSEQYYSKGKQGPWTDIYSICATMYRMLTGVNPPNSIERLSGDEYVSPVAHGVNVSPKMEYVLQKGLAVKPEDRYQNIKHLMEDLFEGKAQVNNAQSSMPQQAVAQASYNVHNMQSQGVMQYPTQNVSYQQNTGYTAQSYVQETKSKVWIPIVIVVLLLCVVAGIAVPAILKSNDSEDKTTSSYSSDDSDEKKTEEDITTEATTETTTEATTETVVDSSGAVVYSKDGFEVILSDGYEYDAASSDDEDYYYFDESGNRGFMIFSGPTEGATEEDFVESLESTMLESYGEDNYFVDEYTYNGHKCTEFGAIDYSEEETLYMIVAFCYKPDEYVCIMYMTYDEDDDFYDYEETMNTLNYYN